MNKRLKIDSPLNIGNRIYECRAKLKLTQEQLSEYVGCTPNYIGQLERGTKTLSLSMVERICFFFGISYDYLLLGENTKNNTSTDNITNNILQMVEQFSPNEKELCYQILKDIIMLSRSTK